MVFFEGIAKIIEGDIIDKSDESGDDYSNISIFLSVESEVFSNEDMNSKMNYIKNLQFDGELFIGDNKYTMDKGTVEEEKSLKIEGINVDPTVISAYNSCVSSVRIIIENFFGRMMTLFKMASDSFDLDHCWYDKFNKLMCALTNAHLEFHPLKEFDFSIFVSDSSESHQCNDNNIKLINIPYKARKILKDMGCIQTDTDEMTVGDLSLHGGSGSNNPKANIMIPNRSTFVEIEEGMNTSTEQKRVDESKLSTKEAVDQIN